MLFALSLLASVFVSTVSGQAESVTQLCVDLAHDRVDQRCFGTSMKIQCKTALKPPVANLNRSMEFCLAWEEEPEGLQCIKTGKEPHKDRGFLNEGRRFLNSGKRPMSLDQIIEVCTGARSRDPARCTYRLWGDELATKDTARMFCKGIQTNDATECFVSGISALMGEWQTANNRTSMDLGLFENQTWDNITSLMDECHADVLLPDGFGWTERLWNKVKPLVDDGLVLMKLAYENPFRKGRQDRNYPELFAHVGHVADYFPANDEDANLIDFELSPLNDKDLATKIRAMRRRISGHQRGRGNSFVGASGIVESAPSMYDKTRLYTVKGKSFSSDQPFYFEKQLVGMAHENLRLGLDVKNAENLLLEQLYDLSGNEFVNKSTTLFQLVQIPPWLGRNPNGLDGIGAAVKLTMRAADLYRAQRQLMDVMFWKVVETGLSKTAQKYKKIVKNELDKIIPEPVANIKRDTAAIAQALNDSLEAYLHNYKTEYSTLLFRMQQWAQLSSTLYVPPSYLDLFGTVDAVGGGANSTNATNSTS